MANFLYILRIIRKIIFALMILSIFAFAVFLVMGVIQNNSLAGKTIDLFTISFWVIVGVATAMILTSSLLSAKIKSLKKNQSVEGREKETQISSLKNQVKSLENEQAKTKKELAKAQKEIENLRETETSTNAELRQLKESLETANKECARLNKEKTVQQETISRQQQELEQILNQRLELKNTLKQKGQLIQSLQEANQDMAAKVQGLESNIVELNQEIETDQETISRQKEELKQAQAQYSELQNTLKEFQNSKQDMTKKIQELELNIIELEKEKEANQEAISQQKDELKQTSSQRLELQNILEDKEQIIRTLQNTGLGMTAKIQDFESRLQELNREKETQQETIFRQQQNLDQGITERSELRKNVREKEQLIKKLESANQDITKEIQRLESNIVELNQKIQTSQEIISRHRDELKQVNSQLAELQDTLKEKEQQIQKLEDAYKTRDAKLKEAQSHIYELEEQRQAQKSYEPSFESRVEKENKKEKNEPDKERLGKGEKLAEVLLENKFITKEALEKALQLQKKYRGNLLRFLLVNSEIKEDQLAECLTSQFKVPYLPLNTYDISDDVAELLPYELVEEYWVVPVDKIDNSLMVVMVDPFDKLVIKKIEELTGCTVKVYTSLFSEIAEKIRQFYKINIRGLDTQGNPVSPLFVNKGESKTRERRRAVRFKATLPIEITYDGHTAKSKTEDICWDGLSFRLNHELPVCSTVTIELSLNESEAEKKEQPPVTAVAEVRRATPLEDNKFMIGTRLLKIPKEDIYSIIKRVSENRNLE